MAGTGRPTVGEIKRVHLQIEENLLTHVARIFERDPKLSKLEKRDDTNRLKFLLEEFIRSDGKCVTSYGSEKAAMDDRIAKLEKSIAEWDAIKEKFKTSLAKIQVKESQQTPPSPKSP